MAGRDGEGQSFTPGSRKRDRTIDDALTTMERLAVWLDEAKQVNVWEHTENSVQTAMLHGMLVHLEQEISQLLALGGPELHETVRTLRTLAGQEKGQ